MKQIITKYFEGCATNLEQLELLEWLRVKGNRKEFNAYKTEWESKLNLQQLPAESENTWIHIQENLMQKTYSVHRKSRNLNLLFRVAAVVFFLISLGSVFFHISNYSHPTEDFFTCVMAEKGQITKMKLPDGSWVWLNSGSEISYNNMFAENNRIIELKGEAYFDVERNEEVPFVVNCGELQVKVLGTKFNVSAYPEAPNIEVVLEKGSVELLDSKVESFHCVLKPDERAVFNITDSELLVGAVNASKFTMWKEGVMNVYDQTLEELVERLEIRYNQEFVLDDEVRDMRYTFTVKNESLHEVIQLMKKITPIKASQEHDTIYFKIDHSKDKQK